MPDTSNSFEIIVGRGPTRRRIQLPIEEAPEVIRQSALALARRQSLANVRLRGMAAAAPTEDGQPPRLALFLEGWAPLSIRLDWEQARGLAELAASMLENAKPEDGKG